MGQRIGLIAILITVTGGWVLGRGGYKTQTLDWRKREKERRLKKEKEIMVYENSYHLFIYSFLIKRKRKYIKTKTL